MNFWEKISNMGLDLTLNQSQQRKIILTNRLVYFSFVTILTFVPLLYVLKIDAPIFPTLFMLFISLLSFYLAKKKKHQLALLLLVIVQIIYVITLNAMPQLVAPIYLGVILHLFLIPAMLVGIVLLKKIKHSLLFTGFIIAVYLLIEVIKFRSQISSTSISTPFFILYIFDVIIIFFSIYYYISQFKSIDNGYIIDIIKQQKKIKKQHLELSKTHDKIKQSIDYALKIQSALLPHTDTITTIIDNHFLLYLPKDIVAGDFYWVEEDEDYKYLAIADCTGHGVPGALVSIVCINALNRAIHEFELSNTGAILDQTRAIIIEELNDSKNHIADGMDISLLKIPKDNNTTNLMIEFSGANNSIYIVRDNQLIEFNGCKQPIGSHINMQPFKTQKIPAYKNDTVYLFTDGYPDQFGGVKGKKFKKKPFKELLLSISNLPPREQSVQLKNTLNSWKSNIEQVDDITILGFKLS